MFSSTITGRTFSMASASLVSSSRNSMVACVSRSRQWRGAIQDEEQQVGRGGCGARAFDANTLDGIIAWSEASGVYQVQGDAAEERAFLDSVACGPGDGRDDGAFAAQECVEQARFADIGPPDNGDT